MDDQVWNASSFSKNLERFLDGEIAAKFFERVLTEVRAQSLLSAEHFTVDGTLIKAWASQRRFRPRSGGDAGPGAMSGCNPDVDFRGERRSNETHASTTDPQARLYRKARNVGADLCYSGHVVMDNRHGLVAAATVTPPSGHAECDAALDLLKGLDRHQRSTVDVARSYDTARFSAGSRWLGITPHVASKRHGGAVDGRTTGHATRSPLDNTGKVPERQ